MADNLGLTIKFRGDTVEFKNDINGINNALKLLKADAKSLNKELKLDPSNVEKMGQSLENLKEQQKLLIEAVQRFQKEIDGTKIDTAKDEKQLLALRNGLSDCEIMLRKVNEEIELFNVKDISNFGKKLTSVSNDLNTISNVLGEIGRQFTLISTASAGALAIGIKYNAEMEQYTIALTTALGSEAKALETIEQIKKDATKTPWSVSELVEYNRTLISTGLSAEESEKIILALGDAISAVGGSSDTYSRMIQNLQQIKNAGTATAMDIRQFAYAGINIYGILADYLGKTTDEINEQDRTWENIIGALEKASSQGGLYFGAMENQAESLTSQLSKLKDEYSQALGEIAEALLPTIKELLSYVKSFATWLKSLSEEQKEVLGRILLITAAIAPLFTGLSKITMSVSSLTGKLGKLFQNKSFLLFANNQKNSITTLLQTIKSFVGSNGGILGTLVAPLKAICGYVTGLGLMLEQYGISGVIFSIGQSLGNVISKIVGLLGPAGTLVAVFTLLYTQSEDFRNAINNLVTTLFSALQPVLSSLWEILKGLWSFISTYILPIVNSLINIIGSGLAFIINSVLVPAINFAKQRFELLRDMIEAIINVIKDLYAKFQESAAFQTIQSALEILISAFTKVRDVVASVVDWVSNAINKLKEFFSFDGKSVNVSTNYSNSGGYGSGGYGSGGFASGGYNFTINVTNQGGSLTANNIKGWARMLTDQINENLGKEM